MNWWSLFGTLSLLLSGSAEEQHLVSPHTERGTSAFMSAVGLANETHHQATPTLPPPDSSSSPPSADEWLKPKCKEKEGCDRPLNCFNYSSTMESAGAVLATSLNLEQILENPAVVNTCAVVMFYASWCPFSVAFARQFNALGRSYKELPVLAVNFAENDLSYKYLTAYIPVVSFYYRGKVIYRFKATESYEELLEQITKMTGFQPTRVALNDTENEYPVPTVRTDGDKVYVLMGTGWIIFVILVYVCRTKTVSEWIASKFHRTKRD